MLYSQQQTHHNNALVVDANSDTRKVIVTTLRQMGIRKVDVSLSKAGAVQHVRYHAQDDLYYSLAILVGGSQTILDTLAGLQEEMSIPHIDVLAICNEPSPQFIDQLYRYGVSGCLRLPFTLSQLQSRIMCDYHLAAMERMPAFKIAQ